MGAVQQVHAALLAARPHSCMAVAAEHPGEGGPGCWQRGRASWLPKLQIEHHYLQGQAT